MNTVSKWGNSLGVRLPKHLAAAIGLSEGSQIDFEVSDGSIRITPTRPRYKLADLLKDYDPKEAPGEMDWGELQGDEII